MRNLPNVASAIAAHLREDRHVPFILTAYLTERAAAAVRRRLEQAHGTPAHVAFDLMTHTARFAAISALRRLVERSETLSALLAERATEPERWYAAVAAEAVPATLFNLRSDFTSRYGFAVITPEAIDRLAQLCRGRQVLEVGAGNGYLAQQLERAGVAILPTDPNEPGNSGYHLGQLRHTQITTLDAAAAIRSQTQRDLLWSWPCPSHESAAALKQFRGELFVYIGEQFDGCTGGTAFTDLLERNFTPVEFIPIPSFPDVRDCIGVYQRKR